MGWRRTPARWLHRQKHRRPPPQWLLRLQRRLPQQLLLPRLRMALARVLGSSVAGMAGLGPLAVLLATLATSSPNGTRSAIRLGGCAGETVNVARPMLQQVNNGQAAVCALCVCVCVLD